MDFEYSSIDKALEDLRAGKVILVTDDPDPGKKSAGGHKGRRQYCSQRHLPDGYFHAGWDVHCRCDGGDDPKKQSFSGEGGRQGKSGAGDGG